jgi:hypothetical protein
MQSIGNHLITKHVVANKKQQYAMLNNVCISIQSDNSKGIAITKKKESF